MTRFRLTWIAGALLATFVVVAGAAVLFLKSRWAADYVERRTVAFLEARLNARVELGSIELSLFPRIAVSGTGLRLTRNGDDAATPFLSVERFQIAGSPWTLPRRHVSLVELDGLDFHVIRGSSSPAMSRPTGDVLVDTIVVRNGRLVIVPRDPEKLPLEFALHEVRMTGFGFDRSATYSAQITNPKPTALIQAEGRIGPWDTMSIGATALSGVYLLADGDLGSIKGIGGELQSSGKFDGRLERIHVEGTTNSKNFQLMLAGNPLPLATKYVAIVDGTSGDTTLEQVDAMLGDSHLIARGSISSMPGAPARSIILDVTADNAKFEDLLRLSVGAQEPPMRGVLNLTTSFVLPPSDEDVPLRLQLKGQFTITRGQFASDTVQDKVDELSRRGRGQPGNQNVANVLSAFGGSFSLQKGTLTLPRLRFSVNGAKVNLSGNYRLPTQALNFTGSLALDAPVSKTVTGFKSVLLKAVDPLFRRNGAGTLLPIAIRGTVSKPAFKVEARRIFTRD